LAGNNICLSASLPRVIECSAKLQEIVPQKARGKSAQGQCRRMCKERHMRSARPVSYTFQDFIV